MPLQLFTPDDKELSKGGGSVSPKLCTGIKILPAYAVDHFDRALSRCVGTLDEAGLMLLRWSLPTLLSVLPFRHLLEAKDIILFLFCHLFTIFICLRTGHDLTVNIYGSIGFRMSSM